MSRKVYVNGTQFLDTNSPYPEWDDYIRSQDIEIGPDGRYDGNVTDFMGLLEVTERIVMRLEKERREKYDRVIKSIQKNRSIRLDKALESVMLIVGTSSIFNLQAIPNIISTQREDDPFKKSLFDYLYTATTTCYAFMPYTLFRICEPDLQSMDCFMKDGHFRCYELKPGRTIRVHTD